MKKALQVMAVVGVVVLLTVSVGRALASSESPEQPGNGGGNGGGGGQGGHGSEGGHEGESGHGSDSGCSGEEDPQNENLNLGGALNELMHERLAEELGLTVDELEARHDAGESFMQIALAQGLSKQDAAALMRTIRDEAAAKAVADGLVTQEEADVWLSRGNQINTGGEGAGSQDGHGKGGGQGGGQGHEHEEGEGHGDCHGHGHGQGQPIDG